VIVGLYAPDARTDDPAVVVFPVDASAFDASTGGPEEVLVFGDIGPNRCLVVDGPRGLVWPLLNPLPPGPRDRGR
jgi:hypothetical protein